MNQQQLEIPFKNLGELIDNAALQYGDEILWKSLDDDAVLTFSDFSAQSMRLAQALHAIGVDKGTHVAVMLPSIPAFALTWAAIARLGAVVIPVNYQYTSSELKYVLSDGDAVFLIIDEARAALLGELPPEAQPVPDSRVILHGASHPRYALDWQRLMDTESSALADIPEARPGDLMSIQYTSGTTGFPKGCMLTQDYWLVLGAVRSFQFPKPRRMLVDKPLSYMGGIWRLLICLYVGTTACVAHRFTLSGMQQRIVENQIDFFSVTDPVAKLPVHPGIKDMTFSCITASGLNQEAHRIIEEKFNAPVREMYGMTEIGSAIYMPIEDGAMSGSGSCGIPVPFRECRIVGPDGRDVEVGQTGELWVRGRAICQGYYKKELATQEAFEGEWFRTGDLFRQDENGYFYILGRIKDSIRRSGENISSHEVAAAVTSLPGVMEAVAIGVPDDFRGEEVKVFIILQRDTSQEQLPPDRVISHCEDRLAPFKVPRYIQYVSDFPRTSSGKIAVNSIKTDHTYSNGPVFDRTRNIWI